MGFYIVSNLHIFYNLTLNPSYRHSAYTTNTKKLIKYKINRTEAATTNVVAQGEVAAHSHLVVRGMRVGLASSNFYVFLVSTYHFIITYSFILNNF